VGKGELADGRERLPRDTSNVVVQTKPQILTTGSHKAEKGYESTISLKPRMTASDRFIPGFLPGLKSIWFALLSILLISSPRAFPSALPSSAMCSAAIRQSFGFPQGWVASVHKPQGESHRVLGFQRLHGAPSGGFPIGGKSQYLGLSRSLRRLRVRGKSHSQISISTSTSDGGPGRVAFFFSSIESRRMWVLCRAVRELNNVLGLLGIAWEDGRGIVGGIASY
jgi:hypothetical protein